MYQNGFIPYSSYGNLGAGMRMGNMSNLMYGGAGAGASAGAKAGLFGRLAGGIGKFNFGSFLNTTQKTLGVINQAIPVFYQVKPMFNNAKTMFKVMGALKEDDKKSTTTATTTVNPTTSSVQTNVSREASTTPVTPLTITDQPQFFL